jgi:5-methylcytosine-specific restriction endonuclease McrA
MFKKYTTGSRVQYGIAMADRRHLQYIRQRLIAEHGMVCGLCGKPIESESELTVDHIIPRAMGGSTTYENCQLAHKACNFRKGNKYIDPEIMENNAEITKNGVDKA